jgi:hypothetical protein
MFANWLFAFLALGFTAYALGGDGSIEGKDKAPYGYEDFNAFCIKNYGAEKEPLVYEKYGKELRMLPDGRWLHASENSAAIGWDTNLPAKSCVEYGETADYGNKTAEPERHFYVHLHYLTGLKPNAVYHYRLVAVDERGNRVASKDERFETKAIPGAIHVPDDLKGPPYDLNKEGAVYVLTKDIIADDTAFRVKADNVTLDLNGHLVVYNNKAKKPETWKFEDYYAKADYGVFVTSTVNATASATEVGHPRNGTRILNGRIEQGAGDDRASKADTVGFNPILIKSSAQYEVAGVSLAYGSSQMIGLHSFWCPDTEVKIHHNVFLDRGSDILWRHGTGCGALMIDPEKSGGVHHNLVKRTRQSGLRGSRRLDNNEIYVDSFTINAFGCVLANDSEAHGNRIFGTGFNFFAVGSTGFSGQKVGDKNLKFHDNFIHIVGHDTSARWINHEKWGDINTLSGLRVTTYGNGGAPRENLEYWNNLIVLTGTENCELRGTEFISDVSVKHVVAHDNIVKVEVRDEKTKRAACLVAQGHHEKADSLPIVYKDNTLISNICHIRFGDAYAWGNTHHFIGCKFVKIGNNPKYHTFAFGGYYWNFGHIVRDAEFGPGTAYNDVLWGPTEEQSNYSVEWTLAITTAPKASVRIADKTGKEVFAGEADEKGAVSVPLRQCTIHPPKVRKQAKCAEGEGETGGVEETFTPHTVTITKDGKTATKSITMDKKQTVELKPE